MLVYQRVMAMHSQAIKKVAGTSRGHPFMTLHDIQKVENMVPGWCKWCWPYMFRLPIFFMACYT